MTDATHRIKEGRRALGSVEELASGAASAWGSLSDGALAWGSLSDEASAWVRLQS